MQPLRRAGRALRRWAFLLHRWLGIALSLLMALWALSGFVMMYVSWPETTALERARGSAPLDLSGCCDRVEFPQGQIDAARVEMVGERPVLRWESGRAGGLVSLDTDATTAISVDTAKAVAEGYLRHSSGRTAPASAAFVESDQWTVTGEFRALAPLFKVEFADPAATTLYVSGATGQVVQDTTGFERFWNWLGAIPHWLYFRQLREDVPLWTTVVVYASVLGVFLTLTGIYAGVRMYGRGKRRSPFRGVAMWHHWAGLVFGLVTLTWVFSGLASMQPWGWLESEGPGEELAAMAGRPASGRDAEALVRALAEARPAGIVAAELAVQGGRPWAILIDREGRRQRAALPGLAPAAPSAAELAALGRSARPGAPVASEGLIDSGDAYHYDHHSSPAVLPAWRVVWDDAEGRRLYLDARTGEPVGFVDSGSRGFRWWHYALHRLDLPGLRERPVWDAVMLPLLAGVALLCLLGVAMGMRRLRRWERATRH